jgi:hypothetical protein
MSDGKSSGGFTAKVVATVFASVLAPLGVGLGIRYFGPAEKPSPTTSAMAHDTGKVVPSKKQAGHPNAAQKLTASSEPSPDPSTNSPAVTGKGHHKKVK